MFSYKIKQLDDGVLIHLNGDLDIDVSEVMEEEILPAIIKYKKIELDFHNVPFVDSTGIGLLISLVESLKNNEDDVHIIIKNVQPLVQEVFEMLQLNEILGETVFFLGEAN